MAGRGKSKGYTTLFRELGTPEGEFHATFATKNRKLRRAARRLARAYPDDPVIQRFVDTLEQDRHELWEAWKRGALSPEMQRIVASVRIPHHGPKVGSDIPPERKEPPIDQPRLPGLRAAARRAR